ncbi:hypothetical protein N431DRAFT_84662 [Stipitochalara longipes BDJ]|nr:hypothetical protein N431DRAFT_84662 [Stipitochalara longipes BDJ]
MLDGPLGGHSGKSGLALGHLDVLSLATTSDRCPSPGPHSALHVAPAKLALPLLPICIDASRCPLHSPPLSSSLLLPHAAACCWPLQRPLHLLANTRCIPPSPPCCTQSVSPSCWSMLDRHRHLETRKEPHRFPLWKHIHMTIHPSLPSALLLKALSTSLSITFLQATV